MQPALYRAERPEIFEDIIGQKQIVRILKNQIKSGTVSQAYLFAGTHGTGKTSTARILAKALNCLNADNAGANAGGDDTAVIPCGECANCKAIKDGKFVDVIELDAASNNGVDDLRAIIDLVKYPPTIGKYKVFIIDEVHMLSTGAENAFLKTLEEPPEYAIFILATTDPQKVRATIRSRCMELNFKRVSEDDLIEGMEKICQKKGVGVTGDALVTIAGKADGSVRDALSILEQCMAAGDANIDRNLVLEYIGSAGEEFFLELTDAVYSGEIGRALTDINSAVSDGKDSKVLLSDWLEHYRKLMITKYVSKAEKIISASEENIERIRSQAQQIDIGHIEKAIRLISEYINAGRYSDRPRILLETAVVRLAGVDADISASMMGTPRPASSPRSTGSASSTSSSARPASSPMSSGSAGSARPSGQAGVTRNSNSASQARPTSSARTSNSASASRQPSTTRQASNSGQPSSASAVSSSASNNTSRNASSNASKPHAVARGAQDMWARISAELSKGQPSFASIVVPNSMARSFNGDELVVVVKKSKLSFTKNFQDEINKCAKAMFGSNVYVSMVAGDIEAEMHGESQANSRAELHREAHADSRAESQADEQRGAQSFLQEDLQAEANAEAQAEFEAEVDSQAEAEAESEAYAGSQAEADADAEADSQADEPRTQNAWNIEGDEDLAEELASDLGSMFGIEVSISDN